MPAVGAKELAELVDRHAVALEFYAASWTASPEDCVQEAFIELASQQERPEYVLAWLYRVVRNRALNELRAARRRNEHEREAAVLESSSGDRNEAELEIEAALASLQPAEREIVVLRIWSGLTWHQIAELTETSSSTAQRRFVASLEKLKFKLEPSWELDSTCRQN